MRGNKSLKYCLLHLSNQLKHTFSFKTESQWWLQQMKYMHMKMYGIKDCFP